MIYILSWAYIIWDIITLVFTSNFYSTNTKSMQNCFVVIYIAAYSYHEYTGKISPSMFIISGQWSYIVVQTTVLQNTFQIISPMRNYILTLLDNNVCVVKTIRGFQCFLILSLCPDKQLKQSLYNNDVLEKIKNWTLIFYFPH